MGLRFVLILCAVIILLGLLNALIWFGRVASSKNTATDPGFGGLIFSAGIILVGFFGGVIAILAMA